MNEQYQYNVVNQWYGLFKIHELCFFWWGFWFWKCCCVIVMLIGQVSTCYILISNWTLYMFSSARKIWCLSHNRSQWTKEGQGKNNSSSPFLKNVTSVSNELLWGCIVAASYMIILDTKRIILLQIFQISLMFKYPYCLQKSRRNSYLFVDSNQPQVTNCLWLIVLVESNDFQKCVML